MEKNAREKVIHDLLINNNELRIDLLSILNLDNNVDNLELVHEDKYINGIIADFTLLYNNKIEAIIECKASDINVTDYVRGIGQVFQYEYFFENNISLKSKTYSDNFKSILLIPSDVFNDNVFNIGKFKYPNTTILVELNRENNVARKITSSELKKLSTVEVNKVTSISQYYVRDNRIFELYMLLRYLCIKKLKNVKILKRKVVEFDLQKIKTINNNNWRNAWISLSSLGLIDSKNLPTSSGFIFGNYEFAEFAYMMYISYLRPYFKVLIEYFVEDKLNLNKTNKEISLDIKRKFKGQDVLFLTQSDGRYLSSWLNILRDDYGCLFFEKKSKCRDLIYNPLELNKKSLMDRIEKKSIAYNYIEKINEL